MKNLRIHYIQHVPFEGIGLIEDWIKEKGHVVSGTLLEEGSHSPEPGAFDWLIVMGGPMSINDDEKYPWLAAKLSEWHFFSISFVARH
jgi:GMP synthase-like glutamine amidotransferase